MKYNGQDIETLYKENMLAAEQLLASLSVADCLSQELKAIGIVPEIEEQKAL